VRIVPALDRGLRILSLLATENRRMKVSDIAQILAIPRSATYELIHTLATHGAIRQFDNGEIDLGPKVLALGSAYGRRLDFVQTAQAAAQAVMQQCDETVQIGVLDGRHVLYIAKADSNRQVRLVSTVGVRLPAHCTALGKVLLAFLPEAQLAQCLDGVTLEALTDRSITDKAALSAQLAQVRRDLFAPEECESNLDVACVAAPVWNAQGENVAAMSISVPVSRMTPEHRAVLQGIVIAGAAKLSQEMGYILPATRRAEERLQHA
jgi:DNA-binding IclR family transcriptional regulator